MKFIVNKYTNIVVHVGYVAELVENGINIGDCVLGNASLYVIHHDIDIPWHIRPQKYKFIDGSFVINEGYVGTTEQLEEEIRLMKENAKKPNEKYIEIDKVNVDIETIRAAKIEQLKQLCTETIYEGFLSTSIPGKFFGFNDKDQANFGQVYLLVISGDNNGAPIKWKSKQGIVTMTEAQFKALVIESKNHKIAMQTRYWQKEAQVLAATTNAQIDEINW